MKFNFFKTALLPLGLILIFSIAGMAQKFQRSYGNGQDNYFHKVIPDGKNNYYVIGSEDNYGVVSHVLQNGQLDWTMKFIDPCVFFDAEYVLTIPGQPGNLMVVGSTLPFDNTNKSLLMMVTPNGGLLSSNLYDVAQNGVEGFTRIAQKSGGYAVTGFFNDPSFSNNVIMLDVLPTDVINSANMYGNAGDNGYFYDVETMWPNEYIVAGYDGNAGVIFRLDNSVLPPTLLAGVRDPSVQVFNDLALDGTNIIAAGASITPGGKPLLRCFDANLLPIWTVEVSNLDIIHQVEKSFVNNDIYLVGTKVINGVDRAVVVRFTHTPGGPQYVWAKYLDNGETGHVTGQITIRPNVPSDIAFADGKTGIPGNFGQSDAFMAVTNDNLDSYCTKIHSVSFMADSPFLEGPELDFIDFTTLTPVGGMDYDHIDWLEKGVCFDPTPVVPCGDIKAFVEPEYDERRIGFDWDMAQAGIVALAYDPPSGSVFPVGTTQVTASATFATGDTASCTFEVVVEKLPFDTLQPPLHATPDGLFDRMRDQYGNPYRLADLQVPEPASGNLLCTNSGYFSLYFEPGSGMEGNTIVESARRAVICQVFSDISQFIQQPNPANPAKVNIWVRDMSLIPSVPNPNTSNMLGVAGAFYAMPNGVPSKGGIADSEIWKTINSGVDSYAGVVSPLGVQIGGGFYHGFVGFNFVNSTVDWHTDLTTITAASLYDLYSVALHEVTHALGFASVIVSANNTGESFFAPGFPKYFSRYDSFLESPASLGSLPLITNPAACSPMYDYEFNPNLANTDVLKPNPNNDPANPDKTVCVHAIEFASTSVNQSVFTPNHFYNGSSLSHFEDECRKPTPQPNNEYYVMSNMAGTGPNFMKRYLKPEERDVLCQLGYHVAGQYGNPPHLTFYDYQTPDCTGLGVAGINDGIGPNGAYLYTVAVSGTSPAIFPLTNDHGAVSFECLETVIGTGSPSSPAGTSFTLNAGATPGLNLLRYVPVSASGDRGNITYILVYVQAPGCPADACNMVSNGGFESGTGCGGPPPNGTARIDCWQALVDSPDLFTRTCPFSNLQVGVSTFSSSPPTDSYNGAPNDKFLGMGIFRNPSVGIISEAAQTGLSVSINPGETYELSFWAKTNNNFPVVGNNVPAQIQCTSAPVYPLAQMWLYPKNAFVPFFPDVTVPADNQWHYFSNTFTFTGSSPHSNLILVFSDVNFPANANASYVFLDDVKLIKITTPVTFTPPATACVNFPPVSLNSTVSTPGGIFTGTGVSLSGTNYMFDPATAGLGAHVITYTYTDINGCEFTLIGSITVVTCPDPCVCAPPTLIVTQSGQSFNLACTQGAPTPVLPCPADDVTVTGFFGCEDANGNPCTDTPVDWDLTGPNGFISNGTSSTNNLSLTFPETDVDDFGTYFLSLSTLCNGATDPCTCTARWIRDDCDACMCGTFSNMFFKGVTQPATCGGPPVTVGCPVLGHAFSYVFSGQYTCQGNCPALQTINWTLSGPSGTTSGFAQHANTPYFAIGLPPTYFTQNGLYTLTLMPDCDGIACPPCVIQFNVSCPSLCPCDVADFGSDLSKGFSVTKWNNSCKACFTPNALTDCDMVEWFVGGISQGMVSGTQTFCHVFPHSGIFNVMMSVTRKKSDGTVCATGSISKNVAVACGPVGDCGGSVYANPRFSGGAVAGGLKSGGLSDGWDAPWGEPVVVEGEPGSTDGWTIELAGNFDTSGVLSTFEPVCLEKTTGTITARFAIKDKGTRGRFVFELYREEGFEVNNLANYWNPIRCLRPASIDLDPLDEGWYELEIPFDLSEWDTFDLCGDFPGVLVRPAIYVTNALGNNQGGPETFTVVHLDNFCLDGTLVAVDEPGRQRSFSLFPNPASGALTLHTEGIYLKTGKLQVLDLWGRTVQVEALPDGVQEHSFSIATLPAGVYFIKILTDGVPVWTEKIVKQ